MNIEVARRIFNGLDGIDQYVDFLSDGWIVVDGEFTPKQLRALATIGDYLASARREKGECGI